MGAKPVFKRYKNPVYLACGIVISLFSCGCSHSNLFRTIPTPVDIHEKRYLADTRKLVLDKDFNAADRETQRALKYYRHTPDMKDMVLSNYAQTAQLISDLLTRIMDDEKTKQDLSAEIQLSEERIKTLTQTVESLKKEAGILEKKIKNLKNGIKLLQQQINRLKEIDLNPAGPEKPAENAVPVMNKGTL